MKKTLRDRLLKDVYFYFKGEPYVATYPEHNKVHLKDIIPGSIYEIEDTLFNDYEHSLDALTSVLDSGEEDFAANLLYEARPPEAREIMKKYEQHLKSPDPKIIRVRLMETYYSLHRIQRRYKMTSLDQLLMNDLGMFIDIVQSSRVKK
jgi:hypothetical protein